MPEEDLELPDESDLEEAPAGSPLRVIAVVILLLVLLGAGGWWGYSYYEAKNAERARTEARAAAQQKAAQEAKRATEDAKMAEDLQRQKVAADEALQRAQADRDRVANELELLQKSRAGTKRSK